MNDMLFAAIYTFCLIYLKLTFGLSHLLCFLSSFYSISSSTFFVF